MENTTIQNALISFFCNKVVVLAEKRKTNNWLADQLDMNRTTVSKWCRNEMQPRIETLFQIANVLNIDVSELLVSNEIN